MFIENTAERAISGTSSRLVVLVPCELQNLANFSQEIHWLAQKLGRDVLFLSLDQNNENKLASSRLLATLESITHDATLTVQSMQVKASNWMEAVGRIARPEDLIVCHKEQVARISAFTSIPLSDYLAHERNFQVHILTGVYAFQAAHSRNWALNLLFWLGFLIIIAGFSFLEFQAQVLLSGAAEKLIFCILFLVEFGLIYGWTKITS